MNRIRRYGVYSCARILYGAALSAVMAFSGGGQAAGAASAEGITRAAQAESGDNMTEQTASSLSKVDRTKWLYNSDGDVWYQLGIRYAENLPDEDTDSLAIFVPGSYFDGQDNGDGTYTCVLNPDQEVNGYTASSAPIVLPVNTPGYSAQAELTEYTDVSDYTEEGFVYVHIGCRGRDAGAPYGVTDLKAGIRYLRYNEGLIAGNTERIFVFGMSGGGAQSAVLGAAGDSSLYDPYLKETGAVEGVSDAVFGAMCWCPITSLDTGDAAYEWNMGSTRTGLSDDEQAISDALADSYADTISQLGLKDEEGNALTLEQSDDGIDQAGSYYEYIKSVIESSLENFLSDTEWPYTGSSSGSGAGPGAGGGMPSGEAPSGQAPSGEAPSGDAPSGRMPSGGAASGQTPSGVPSGQTPSGETSPGETSSDLTTESESSSGAPDSAGTQNLSGTSAERSESGQNSSGENIADSMNASAQNDAISRSEGGSALDLSGTYETPQDYIDALNAGGDWVTYDGSTGKVTITSVEAFVKNMKTASKSLGAFDQLDGGQGENTLFGYGDGSGAHFDSTLANILKNLGNDYADDYAQDLTRTDSVGNTVSTRLEMYSPLNYLTEGQPDFGKSTVASYWRIRTGICQGDTALSTEVNLALALRADEQVKSVDFATVWGEGHTMAERTGDATSNFISWVNECVSAES